MQLRIVRAKWLTLGLVALMTSMAAGRDFSGPAEWVTVQTNAIEKWQQTQQSLLPQADCWKGVVVDRKAGEVRVLAEAVGHGANVTAEFLLVGPYSDRAYEAAAVTVALPSKIVQALECLGVKRGGGVESRPFRFWPCGERFSATVRRLDQAHAQARPLQSLITDAEQEAPLIGSGGLVFTGGRWEAAQCISDTNMPSSVISLYNERETIFDVPFQVVQSEVYGRLTLAEALPYGVLLEIVFKPLTLPDGLPRVWPLVITVQSDEPGFAVTIRDAKDAVVHTGALTATLEWLRTQMQAGREPFVTLDLAEALTVQQAREVAQVFVMLDGAGIKLDGKTPTGLYPKAFLPREKWRERPERHPQPFELHIARQPSGTLNKKLVYIEEDWEVEGIDPDLIPHEHPFEKWDELLPLVEKCEGANSKVRLLFVYAPNDLPLRELMPGVHATNARLPLVYVFGN